MLPEFAVPSWGGPLLVSAANSTKPQDNVFQGIINDRRIFTATVFQIFQWIDDGAKKIFYGM